MALSSTRVSFDGENFREQATVLRELVEGNSYDINEKTRLYECPEAFVNGYYGIQKAGSTQYGKFRELFNNEKISSDLASEDVHGILRSMVLNKKFRGRLLAFIRDLVFEKDTNGVMPLIAEPITEKDIPFASDGRLSRLNKLADTAKDGQAKTVKENFVLGEVEHTIRETCPYLRSYRWNKTRLEQVKQYPYDVFTTQLVCPSENVDGVYNFTVTEGTKRVDFAVILMWCQIIYSLCIENDEHAHRGRKGEEARERQIVRYMKKCYSKYTVISIILRINPDKCKGRKTTFAGKNKKDMMLLNPGDLVERIDLAMSVLPRLHEFKPIDGYHRIKICYDDILYKEEQVLFNAS